MTELPWTIIDENGNCQDMFFATEEEANQDILEWETDGYYDMKVVRTSEVQKDN